MVAFVYYGLTINTNELAGNPFVNFALSAFVEIPAIILAMFVVESVGKKNLMTASMIISGIACVTCYLLPLGEHCFQFVNFQLSLLISETEKASNHFCFVYVSSKILVI